jgi:gliding motility-associated-like protein
VKEYKLEIYDRWGELIFESNDVTIGWDGYFKGKLCKSDVYIWKAKGKFYNGSSFNKAGDVTILQ